MRISILLVLPLACCFAAQSAQANEPLSAQVSFADVNVHTRAGAQVLFRRIERAALKVCAPHSAHRLDLSGSRAHTKCLQEAVDRAVADVNQPALNRYASERASRQKSPVKVAQELSP